MSKVDTLPTFIRWVNVPEEYKTKTQLKQLKLKPVNVDKPDAYVKTQIGTKWVIYNLYHINNCIKVKSRVTQIRTFELTDENIAEALYIINKTHEAEITAR